jgi:hypothetical protein
MRTRFLPGLVASALALAAAPALAGDSRWYPGTVPLAGSGNLWLGAVPGGGVVVGSGRSPVLVHVDSRGRIRTGYADDRRYFDERRFRAPPRGHARGWPPGRAVGWHERAPRWDGRRYAPPRAGWRDERGRWRGDRRGGRGRDCDD